MYVGFEAATDYWISFQDMNHLKDICDSISDENLNLAYNSLKKNIGDEIPIDHLKQPYFDNLLEQLSNFGVKIEASLGGNAAIEVMAGRKQQIPITYCGVLPKLNVAEEVIAELSRGFLGHKTDSEPKSFILQLTEGTTERYILCSGKYRRAHDIAPVLGSINTSEISRDSLFGALGFHVLFMNMKFELVREFHDFLDSIVERGITTYSDTGSYANYTELGVKKLFDSIYTNVHMLSINEHELSAIYRAFGHHESDFIEMLYFLLKNSNNLDTVWLHTDKLHIAISKKYSSAKLKQAMENAAAAGCFRVETGNLPTKAEIEKIKRERTLNEEGINYIHKQKYDEKYKDVTIEMIPAYKMQKFTTSVGAGDTAAVTFFGSFLDQVDTCGYKNRGN